MVMIAATTIGDRLIENTGEELGVEIHIAEGLGGGAVGVFVTTLVIGALLMAFAPAYTKRMRTTVFDQPLSSFLYGLFFLLALIILIVLLVITIIGIFVAIPLLILAYLVWAVGSTIAFLAVGYRLVNDPDDWKLPLLIGALLNAGLALTGVGGIISFVIGAIGFGTILHDRWG